MPKRKLVTTQDKQRRKTTTDFVGRQSQLRDFKLNLSLDPGDGNFQMVWNVFGQGGVGKSTLLKQFVRQAEAAGYALAQVDVEDPKMREVTAVLATIAEQFQEAGINVKDFLKRYEDYQQAKGKIAKDPDKPGGFAKDLVSGGLLTAGKIGAEFVPGGSTLLEALPFDKLTDKAGEWTSYLFKTLKNDDDVKLVQDPLAVLTPLLLAPLREAWEDGRNFAILLDTYETHTPELDDWLLRFLRGEYGDVPIFPFVIAGRDPLESSAWRDLDLVRQLELNAFTPAETDDYLSQRAFTSLEEREKIHTLTGGLPVFVSMIADAGPGGDYKEGEAQDRVVERFLKHIADPVQRTLALRAALVNHLNQDVVAVLLEDPDRPRAAELFDWLKSRPFVQRRAGDWAYHPIVRDVMRLHQRAISPATFTDLHERMADHYGRLRQSIQGDAEAPPFEDATYRSYAEAHAFHLLWANYRRNLPEVIEIIATGLTFNYFLRPIIGFLESVEEVYLGKLDWAETWLKPFNEVNEILLLAKRINGLNCFKSSATAAYWWKAQGVRELESEDKIACFKRAVDLKPDDHEAYNIMGIDYGNQGDYAAAITSYQKAVDLKPDFHEAYYNMGNDYGNQGDYAAAITSYQKAVDLKPDYHEAYNNMGHAYDNQGDYAAAIASYQKALEIKPDKDEAYNNMGIAYANQGDYAAAIASYQKALEIKPDKDAAYNNMGIAYRHQGDYAAAIGSYQKAVEIKPDYHEAYNNMGIAYVNQGDYAAAIASYQKAVEIKPDKDEAYNNMGIAYANQGDYAAAIASYQKALEIKPDKDAAYNNMGIAYRHQGDYAAAIGSYQKAVEIKPDYHEAYNNMGNAYVNQGDYAAAIASYQKAVEIKPDKDEAYNNMGFAYVNQGDYAAAIGSYQKAIEIKPDEEEAHHSLGWIYLLQHRFEPAATAFTKSWDLAEGQSGTTAMNLGHVKLLTGDADAARIWYQSSLPLWKNIDNFYSGMASDYEELQMEELGIEREDYEALWKAE